MHPLMFKDQKVLLNQPKPRSYEPSAVQVGLGLQNISFQSITLRKKDMIHNFRRQKKRLMSVKHMFSDFNWLKLFLLYEK